MLPRNSTNVVAIAGLTAVHRRGRRQFPWPLCMEGSRSATRGHYQATDQLVTCERCQRLPSLAREYSLDRAPVFSNRKDGNG